MVKKKINWIIVGIIGSVSSIVAVVGAIFSNLINPKTGAFIMILLLLLAWIISVEFRFSRLNLTTKSHGIKTVPKPIIQEVIDGPDFIYSRKERPTEEIPQIDSQFLDLDKGTFCVWIKVIPELRKTKTKRYIFSHASDWRDNSKYPNAFCLYHSDTFHGWVLRFHGDPQKEGDRLLSKRFLSSPGHDGVRLFSIRWWKNKVNLKYCSTMRLSTDYLDLSIGQNQQTHLYFLVAG